ncbi:MAG: hypothetical protein K2L54_05610 [Clostridiales bacterium]|nr:hypothetical protein [Clostridiales bacterium]
MRSIKNYTPSDTKGSVGKSDIKSEAATLSQKYAGKSESELMHELMQTVTAAKSDGSFSAQRLDEFVEFVSPSLDDESRARLSHLVSMIKGN